MDRDLVLELHQEDKVLLRKVLDYQDHPLLEVQTCHQELVKEDHLMETNRNIKQVLMEQEGLHLTDLKASEFMMLQALIEPHQIDLTFMINLKRKV